MKLPSDAQKERAGQQQALLGALLKKQQAQQQLEEAEREIAQSQAVLATLQFVEQSGEGDESEQ